MLLSTYVITLSITDKIIFIKPQFYNGPQPKMSKQ